MTDPETVKRIPRYLDPSTSIDAFYRHMNSFEVRGLAASTIAAAEYLMRQNDPKQMHDWLMKHSAGERAAIKEHLEKKKVAA